MIAFTCLIGGLVAFALLGVRWGVDSRPESTDPRRPDYPVGIG